MNVVSTKWNSTTAYNSLNLLGLRQLHLTWWTYKASANLTKYCFRHTWLNTTNANLSSLVKTS